MLKINKQFLKKNKKFFYSTEEKLTGRKIRLNAYQLEARVQRGAFVGIPRDAASQKPSFDGNPFLTIFEYDETDLDVKFERGRPKLTAKQFLPLFFILLTISYTFVLWAQPKGLKHELIKLKDYWKKQFESLLNFK